MSALLERLTYQIFRRGTKSYEESQRLASNILIRRGHLDMDGIETESGRNRGLMTPEQRAIDRRVKRDGGKHKDYKYDPIKNYAYKKK